MVQDEYDYLLPDFENRDGSGIRYSFEDWDDEDDYLVLGYTLATEAHDPTGKFEGKDMYCVFWTDGTTDLDGEGIKYLSYDGKVVYCSDDVNVADLESRGLPVS